jgi:photosystem II stability/assembly factor-like uncharacterized protein
MFKAICFSFLVISTTATSQSSKVEIIPIDASSSFRALSVVDDKIAWVSGSMGHVGVSTDGGKTWKLDQLKDFNKLDFRSVYAFDHQHAIIANAGSPAFILKTDDAGKNWRIVYKNEHPNAFLDGIDFWNEKEGIIFGDPINSKLLMMKTTDGGETWNEIKSSPLVKEGEASFAASGTTIRCIGKSKVVIATGGKFSRLWSSEDKGLTWASTETKMVQGTQGSGIFSVAFHHKNAVMVGGDFENDKNQLNQSFYSVDKGNTWVASEIFVRGWRECVEFIDKTTWITVGPSGLEISNDNGKNWTPFSDEQKLHVIRKARKGKLLIAAGYNKIALLHP